MPRKQDFSNSVIYHIRNKETKHIIYVGSTTNFQQRKRQHKFCCNNEKNKHYNINCYVFIRENGGWDFYEVIPIEFLKLENKTQLEIAEQAEIDKQDNLKNKNKAHRTEEDKKNTEYKKNWYEENKDRIAEEGKDYRETNKEEIKIRKKKYYETNKEEIKEQQKKYSEIHKEERNEYSKNYREINKDKINEKKKEIIECPICNSKTTIYHLKRHQETKKCKSFIHRPYPL